MYKALFKIQKDCYDIVNQEIFTPFINCYQIHSITMLINGLAQEQDIDFEIIGHKTKLIGLGYNFDNDDTIVLDINYFYMRPDDIEILGFLIDVSYNNQVKSKEIISKHYVEGQFSLDNGLYKNAVLNFGTALEGILNKSLSNQTLNDVINAYTGSADKNAMHFIRQLRNKVHPNQINVTQDITRKEAIEARNNLEKIIKKI